MIPSDFKVVITVNKTDLWFCKICVASIRYYYPDIQILLLKDELKGKFSTKEIEQYWRVGLIEYPSKKFGWSGAKMHFYCDVQFKGENFLVIDADIVLIGKILDAPFVQNFIGDVMISEEVHNSYETEWFTQTYFDYKKIKELNPLYTYPGYSFNCGQLFCRGNFLSKEILEPYFDFESLPSWKQLDVFPLVDQSVFNYLFPQMASNNQLTIERAHFMIWGEDFNKINPISLESVKTGLEYTKLIHWAGCVRSPTFRNMSRPDILNFFEAYYYSLIPLGPLKRRARKLMPSALEYLKLIKRELKKKIVKNEFLNK